MRNPQQGYQRPLNRTCESVRQKNFKKKRLHTPGGGGEQFKAQLGSIDIAWRHSHQCLELIGVNGP